MKLKFRNLVAVMAFLCVITSSFVGCGGGKESTGAESVQHSYSPLIYEEKATCTKDGCKAYYYCYDCDAVFDENKNEVSQADLVIPATGHKFDANYVCENCKLDLGEIVTEINSLPAVDNITISSLSDITKVITKYDALDENAKTAVQGLVQDGTKLASLGEQVGGIETGVQAKHLWDAGQNQTLQGVKWTEGKDPIYGNYKEIEYDSWQWANVKYNSATRPEGRQVVLFIYNASETDAEISWGHVDPTKSGCIYNNGVGWQNGEDPDVGHQVLRAKSWNTIIIDWTPVYGFNANLFILGHYAGGGASMNGWKFSDVYMMNKDKLPAMQKIIENSKASSESNA